MPHRLAQRLFRLSLTVTSSAEDLLRLVGVRDGQDDKLVPAFPGHIRAPNVDPRLRQLLRDSRKGARSILEEDGHCLLLSKPVFPGLERLFGTCKAALELIVRSSNPREQRHEVGVRRPSLTEFLAARLLE